MVAMEGGDNAIVQCINDEMMEDDEFITKKQGNEKEEVIKGILDFLAASAATRALVGGVMASCEVQLLPLGICCALGLEEPRKG